jgi:hypothetical protein
VWRGHSCPRKANHCAHRPLQNKCFRVSLRLFLDSRVAGERHLPQGERATNAGVVQSFGCSRLTGTRRRRKESPCPVQQRSVLIRRANARLPPATNVAANSARLQELERTRSGATAVIQRARQRSLAIDSETWKHAHQAVFWGNVSAPRGGCGVVCRCMKEGGCAGEAILDRSRA